jgi:hypothetical protein
MTPAEIDIAVNVVEAAYKMGEWLYEVIKAHGDLNDAQKAALIARVKAAGNYVPRDLDALEPLPVPDPKPTAPG